MHQDYKDVSIEDMQRILAYCRHHSVKAGGLFEVYTTPGTDIHMVIVNSCSENGPLEQFRPLGAFYLNYTRLGAITIEVEDPHFDGMESRKRHVAAIRQVIDLLIEHAFPGTEISFNDLPGLAGSK